MDLYHRNHAPTRPRILVAVPAQNESAALPHLIDSLGKQVDAKGRARNDFHTVILVNNSSDNSESVAVRSLRANQLPGTVFSLRTRHRPTIGYLRRVLMNRCLEIMQPTRQTGSLEEWIAWTDADCTVHKDWITHTDQLMQKGAGAVGGHIEVTYDSEGEAHHVHRLRYEYHRHLNLLWRRLSDHRDDQISEHHFNCGASLAISAKAYSKIGRIPDISTEEDKLVWQRIAQKGYRTVRSRRVRVQTSARREGRCHAGLASQLRDMDSTPRRNAWLSVPHLEEVARLIRMSNRVRDSWQFPRMSQRLRSFQKWQNTMTLAFPGWERFLPDQPDSLLATREGHRPIQAGLRCGCMEFLPTVPLSEAIIDSPSGVSTHPIDRTPAFHQRDDRSPWISPPRQNTHERRPQLSGSPQHRPSSA